MIYYTGDIHGSKLEIVTFCMHFQPTKNDTIIILGDVGANYFGNERDAQFKAEFARNPENKDPASGEITLYSNVSPKGVEWQKVKIDDYIN